MIREHFHEDGTPKKKRTKDDAEEVAGYNLALDAYECNFCGWWHLGNRREQ